MHCYLAAISCFHCIDQIRRFIIKKEIIIVIIESNNIILHLRENRNQLCMKIKTHLVTHTARSVTMGSMGWSVVLIVVTDDKLALDVRRVISGAKRGEGVKNWRSSSKSSASLLLVVIVAGFVFVREEEDGYEGGMGSFTEDDVLLLRMEGLFNDSTGFDVVDWLSCLSRFGFFKLRDWLLVLFVKSMTVSAGSTRCRFREVVTGWVMLGVKGAIHIMYVNKEHAIASIQGGRGERTWIVWHNGGRSSNWVCRMRRVLTVIFRYNVGSDLSFKSGKVLCIVVLHGWVYERGARLYASRVKWNLYGTRVCSTPFN